MYGVWWCRGILRRASRLPVSLGLRPYLNGTNMEVEQVKKLNVFLLGLAFMFVFTGFNTMSGIQTLIFNSATNPDSGGFVPGFQGNGFIASAVIYGVFSIASWLAPSVVAWRGPRFAMFVAGLLYAQYIGQLLYPNTYMLYISAAIIGLGAPVIWTAQGNFLAICSDPETISRNSGIVWAMLQVSGLIGNIFAFFMFNGQEYISSSVRTTVGIVLLAITLSGVAVMALLRPASWDTSSSRDQATSPSKALRDSFALFLTTDMLLLSITFFYTGLQLSIWSGVYPTSVGFFGGLGTERKALATIALISIAAGEVIGGATFGFFGHLTSRRGRDPIVVLGFVLSMLAYFLTFLAIPNTANLNETDDPAFIEPNRILVIFIAFLLGFSDACFNTQITSILGGVFKEQSSSAFAIFKFMQSLSAAIAFFYSPYLSLQWQLLAAVTLDIVGTVAFCKVEWSSNNGTLPGPVDNTCGLEEGKDEEEEE